VRFRCCYKDRASERMNGGEGETFHISYSQVSVLRVWTEG